MVLLYESVTVNLFSMRSAISPFLTSASATSLGTDNRRALEGLACAHVGDKISPQVDDKPGVAKLLHAWKRLTAREFCFSSALFSTAPPCIRCERKAGPAQRG